MYRLPVNSNTACVPHTPYTSILKFVPPAGRVCGVATHAVGGNAGYGLLKTTLAVSSLILQNNLMHNYEELLTKMSFISP